MKRLGWLIFAVMAFLASPALGQIGPNTGVTQQGSVTANDCAAWVGPNIIKDAGPCGGSGSVTSVSVVTANGVSGTVATPTTTPAISLMLGAITPSSVAIGAGTAITSSGPGGALASGAYATAYTLPPATNSVLGGVKPDGITITNTAGAISVTTPAPCSAFGTAAGTCAQGSAAVSAIHVQTFCASGCTHTSGTYTPTAGTLSVTMECVGGGGGGAGVVNSTAGQQGGGGGGGAGSYSRRTLSVGSVGTPTISVGAAGAAGASGANNGGAGGNTTIGSLCVGPGGGGGLTTGGGGTGGVAGTGDITGTGQGGGVSSTIAIITFFSFSGYGGTSSPFGSGGAAVQGNATGAPGTGFGGGGSGAFSFNAGGAAAGGAGAGGIAILTEYASQ